MKNIDVKSIKDLDADDCKMIYGGIYPITRRILEAIGTAAHNFYNGATSEDSFFVRSTFF